MLSYSSYIGFIINRNKWFEDTKQKHNDVVAIFESIKLLGVDVGDSSCLFVGLIVWFLVGM